MSTNGSIILLTIKTCHLNTDLFHWFKHDKKSENSKNENRTANVLTKDNSCPTQIIVSLVIYLTGIILLDAVILRSYLLQLCKVSAVSVYLLRRRYKRLTQQCKSNKVS